MSTKAEKYIDGLNEQRRIKLVAEVEITKYCNNHLRYKCDLGENQFQAYLYSSAVDTEPALEISQDDDEIRLSISDIPAFIKWLQETFVDNQGETQ